jgi:hypothetical protein
MKGGGITERPEVGLRVILVWRVWQKEKGFVDLEIGRTWQKCGFSLPRVLSGIADVKSWVFAVILLLICIYVNEISLNTYKKCFHLLKPKFINFPCLRCGPGSVVGIATGYGLDGQGIVCRWGRDFSHLSRPALGPAQPPVQWVTGLSRG